MKNSLSAGLSLIELLISMVLGLALAMSVVQIYVASTAAERERNARQRLQENGRIAMNFLSQKIRIGGYLGCFGGMRGAELDRAIDVPPLTFQATFGVQGWEARGTEPGVINNSVTDVSLVSTNVAEWSSGAIGHVMPKVQAVPNSDIIRVWSVEGMAGTLRSITHGSMPGIQVHNDMDIRAGDLLLISDCERAYIVQACSVTDNGVPANTYTIAITSNCKEGNAFNLQLSSPPQAANSTEVAKLQGTLFYIGKRADKAENPPSLFQRRLGANGTVASAEELIEGVESMQILYGVNLDRDVSRSADAYLPASRVSDFSAVVSVRISLLLQSVEEGVVPSPQSYLFDGVVYDGANGKGALPADSKIRREFSTTIALRNRTLGTLPYQIERR